MTEENLSKEIEKFNTLKLSLEEKYKTTSDTIDEKELPQIDKIDLLKAILGVPVSFLLIIMSVILSIALGIGFIILIYFLESYLIGRVHIAILVMIAIGLLLIICVSVKSIFIAFFKNDSFEVAIPLSEHQQAIKSDIEEVCTKLKIAIPDNILLSFEPTFYVTENTIKTVHREYEGRTLVIGALYLRHLSSLEIKSIISHEMAHFTGRDTLFSLYVAPLYKSITKIVNELRQYGTFDSFNAIAIFLPMMPLILILKGFYFMYAKLEARISRQREMRADYISTLLYGANIFKSALTKVINLGDVFSDVYKEEYAEVLKDNYMFGNYFSHFDDNIINKEELLSGDVLLSNDRTTLYDSHCSANERFEYIPKIYNESLDNLYSEEQYITAEKCLTAIMGDYAYDRLTAYDEYIQEAKAQAQKVEQETMKELEGKNRLLKIIPYACDILLIMAIILLFPALGFDYVGEGTRYGVAIAIICEIVLLFQAESVPKSTLLLFPLAFIYNPFKFIGVSWDYAIWGFINWIAIILFSNCIRLNHVSKFKANKNT